MAKKSEGKSGHWENSKFIPAVKKSNDNARVHVKVKRERNEEPLERLD